MFWARQSTRVVPGNGKPYSFPEYLVILAILYGLGAVTQWAVPYFASILSGKTVQQIREDAFKKLQTLPLRYFDTHKHGDVMSRITNDADNISDGLSQCLSQFLTGIITVLGIVGFMFALNVWIALIVLIITPAFCFGSEIRCCFALRAF